MFLNPATVSLSIQFNTMFMITFIQIFIILAFEQTYKDVNKWIYHFFIVGCLTSYFDFLTYPIVGYGIPLIFLLSLYPSDNKDEFKKFIKTGIAWCSGYIGMWFGKWILGTVLTDENIIKQAFEQINLRTRGNFEEYSYLDVLKLNCNLRKDILIVSVIFALCCIVYLIIKKIPANLKSILSFVAISVIPFAWYFLAANHSYIHYWFTYRNLSIVVMAVSCMGIRLIKNFNS